MFCIITCPGTWVFQNKKQKKANNNAKGGKINRKCFEYVMSQYVGISKQKIAIISLGKMPNGENENAFG